MAKNPTVLQMDIIDLWVQGMSRKDIADALGCTPKTVDNTKADPELKQLYYERCNKEIESLVPLAISRLRGILESDKTQGSVHVAAVREVLDRSHLKELLDTANKEIKVTVSYE